MRTRRSAADLRRTVVLFPICLIQRALMELPLPQQIKPLLANNELCEVLAAYRPDLADKADADGNVGPMLFVRPSRPSRRNLAREMPSRRRCRPALARCCCPSTEHDRCRDRSPLAEGNGLLESGT